MNNNDNKNDKLIYISPSECINWEHHDRGAFELNADEIAQQIREKGQTTPIIVREAKNSHQDPKIKYEVIDGERRLAALKLLANDDIPDIKIKAILRELSLQEAFETQFLANQQNPLSGYSRAKGYKRYLETTNKDQTELAKIEGIDKSNITRRMCYVHIDDAIWNSISDPSKISVNLAHSIFVLLNKAASISDECRAETVNNLVSIAPKIEAGSSAEDIKRLEKEIESKLRSKKDAKGKKTKLKTEKVSNAGKHLYTITPNGEIKIAKSIYKKIGPKMDEFKLELVGVIEHFLMDNDEVEKKRESELSEV